MRTRFYQGSLTLVLVAIGLLACWPRNVQAHPRLLGRWTAQGTQGGAESYDFGPGVYRGDGVWRGTYTYYIADCPVTTGMYELRMATAIMGSLGLTDGLDNGMRVGNIDFAAGVMTYKDTTFNR